MFGLGMDVGIDLGTATVLIYVRGKGVVLREPSVIAIEQDTNQIMAVGEDARKMLGRTPGNIIAIRPLREGVISDYQITEKMLRYFLKKVCGNLIIKPRVIICVPSSVTGVEQKAVLDAAAQAGARDTFLIEEPIAAAIGAGIDISKPYGSMVVDIGGGTTDVAVISLGATVVSDSIKIAGDKFDDALIKYIRKKHNVMIGERTAEELKIQIGSVFERDAEINMDIRGRNLISGLPGTINITSSETMEAFQESVLNIVDTVHFVLEKTPPELIGDISERGIFLTGGGGLIYGLDKLLTQKTGIKVNLVPDAVSCVAIGTGKALENIDVLQKNMTISRHP